MLPVKEVMTEEEHLIERLKMPEQRRAAFEEVVRLYSRPLYQQIRRVVIWHDDADDVLQNTFVKAWLSIDSFRGDAKLGTWLYRIAFNESITFLSKVKQIVPLDEGIAEVGRNLESDPYFDGDEAQLLLEKALMMLPPKQRIVFNLKYFDEMKYEEISEMLNTSVGALKTSYHLAVKKIEDFLKLHL